MIEVHWCVDWVPTAEAEFSHLRYEHALNDRSGFALTVQEDRSLHGLAEAGRLGVRIRDNGVTWWGLATEPVTTLGSSTLVAGISLVSLLGWRIPIPEPTDLTGPWSTDAEHKVTAEPVAAWASWLGAHVAQANARRLPQGCTVVTEGSAPGTVTVRGRWSPTLIDIVAADATDHGVRVDARLAPNNDFDDTEMEVVVSALRNNIGFVLGDNLGQDIGGKIQSYVGGPTVAYVGGDGEGTARKVRAVTLAGPLRRETWVESSGDVNGDLDLEGRAVLAEARKARTIELELSDSPGFQFGLDYEIGDLVTIRLTDVGQASERVRGVETAVANGRVSRKVRVGSGDFRLGRLGELLRVTSARVGRLEGA